MSQKDGTQMGKKIKTDTREGRASGLVVTEDATIIHRNAVIYYCIIAGLVFLLFFEVLDVV
jgi:hypothetical protein